MSKNINKKAEGVPWYVIALIMALAILFVSFFVFKKPASAFGTLISKTVSNAEDDACLSSTKKDLEAGRQPKDMDGDGRADYCDSCVNYPNNKDDDGDGVFYPCDLDDNDKTVGGCKGKLTKDGLCIGGAS